MATSTARRRPLKAYGVVPAASTLERWVKEGRTRAWMVEEIHRRTGETVSEQAISNALRRAGLSRGNRRYDDIIPWRVEMAHQSKYILQLLRMYARRQANLPLTDAQNGKLDHFLDFLKETKGVVAYVADSEEGFFVVDREKRDGKGIIRKPD